MEKNMKQKKKKKIQISSTPVLTTSIGTHCVCVFVVFVVDLTRIQFSLCQSIISLPSQWITACVVDGILKTCNVWVTTSEVCNSLQAPSHPCCLTAPVHTFSIFLSDLFISSLWHTSHGTNSDFPQQYVSSCSYYLQYGSCVVI